MRRARLDAGGTEALRQVKVFARARACVCVRLSVSEVEGRQRSRIGGGRDGRKDVGAGRVVREPV